jgi:hypothetical protein
LEIVPKNIDLSAPQALQIIAIAELEIGIVYLADRAVFFLAFWALLF